MNMPVITRTNQLVRAEDVARLHQLCCKHCGQVRLQRWSCSICGQVRLQRWSCSICGQVRLQRWSRSICGQVIPGYVHCSRDCYVGSLCSSPRNDNYFSVIASAASRSRGCPYCSRDCDVATPLVAMTGRNNGITTLTTFARNDRRG